MDRTLISWNLPNMITVPLMVFITFLVVAIVWQLVQKMTGQGKDNTAPQAVGY